MEILTSSDVVASYTLQVNVVHRPGTSNLLGSFVCWSKGGWFGFCDDLLKFCPVNGCLGLISDEFALTYDERARLSKIDRELVDDIRNWPADIRTRYADFFDLPAVCPVCGAIEIRSKLPDSYGFSMGPSRIAARMADIYYKSLNSDADIYLVKFKDVSAMGRARSELYSADRSFGRYEKLLKTAREGREQAFYSMKAILKDVGSGADITKRFEAMLRA